MKVDDIKRNPKFLTGNAYTCKKLVANARENRRQMTEEESLLWNELRNNKLGVHFRRQHVIGNYIADFICLKCNLVIEVDGGYHETEEQRELDRYRTLYLTSRGLKEIRFTNDEVINDLETVMSKIIKSLI